VLLSEVGADLEAIGRDGGVSSIALNAPPKDNLSKAKNSSLEMCDQIKVECSNSIAKALRGNLKCN